MRRVAVALVVLPIVLLSASPASAAEPMELSAQVTDEAGALPPDDSTVQTAVEELSAGSDIDLYVAFVPSFDTEDVDAWAEETAALSGLGGTDVLLAVAEQGGVYDYSWWVGASSPLSLTALSDRIDREVAPALEAGTWDAAAIAMAEQVGELAGDSEETASTWSAGTTMSVVGGLAVVLLGAHVFSRRRSAVPAVR
jgi:uncharacterized membrane protein YgcG